MARERLDAAGLLGPYADDRLGPGVGGGRSARLPAQRLSAGRPQRHARNRGRGRSGDARALRVLTDEGAAVRSARASTSENVHHGYAITGHISQGATVERTYLLATPERGGAEWAYVASTRQRVDLAVFAVHHEPEHLEAALARSWGRSDAKHLALDLAGPDDRRGAISVAGTELNRLLPERLMHGFTSLRDQREDARAAAAGMGTRDESGGAGREAQRASAETPRTEACPRRVVSPVRGRSTLRRSGLHVRSAARGSACARSLGPRRDDGWPISPHVCDCSR